MFWSSITPKSPRRSRSQCRLQDEFSARVTVFCSLTLLFLVTLLSALSRAQTPLLAKPSGAEPVPQPAVPAVLAAFDKYEVVAMPEAHGLKDLDDFILTLLRNPAFPEKVNDVAVECGNSRYQPILDRYIAGEDVPFAEVRKVWRNTTQAMCGTSGFFEQLFPLVRSINQKLPPGKRLRVLAGDSPIDWDQLTSMKAIKDAPKKFFDRDGTTASVMENEVLSKHRKALMLFGTFHLMHGFSRGAVGTYEKDYPDVTLVVSDLLSFNADLPGRSRNPFADWSVPSVVLARGTWLGALDISQFFSPLIMVDKDCNVTNGFPKEVQKPMGELVDAFLYVGPPNLALKEQIPADIALDNDYMKELQRRDNLTRPPGAPAISERERDENIVKQGESPIREAPQPPDTKALAQNCLARKAQDEGRK